MIPFLMAALAAMLIQNQYVTGNDPSVLYCWQTSVVPLVPLPADFVCDKFNFDFQLVFHCIKSHRSQNGDEWKIDLKFSLIIPMYGERGPVDEKVDCAALLQLTGTSPHLTSSYSLTFNHDLTVGLANGECHGNLTNCTYAVRMRADVLALPLFSRAPDDPLFWNFSSPLCRSDVDWVHSLEASAALHARCPTALPGLAGAAFRALSLKGSFGADARGQLPRFDHLPSLTTLMLEDHPMTDLTAEDLAQSRAITLLILLKNKFHKIPSGIAQLKNITQLTFESTMPNFTFSPETLDELNELRFLTLSGTRIENWTGMFKSLLRLQELNLSGCSMKHFSASFSNFPELQSLNLSKNHLKSLPINAFKGLVKLTTIDLSQNSIQELAAGVFVPGFPEPWITFVNISNNHIAMFSETILASLSALKEVDIGANMIDCGGCETVQLQHWLGSTKTKVKNLGQTEPVACYQPPKLAGRLVELVNFDDVCFIPRRYLWLGIGAPVAGVIAFVVIGGVLFYYRTEVVYLAHLAKVRATSKKKKKKKEQTEISACYDIFVCYSGKNRKWVLRRLTPLLEGHPEHYSLCLFDRDFRLGTHIVTNIVDAIEQSRKVIVVLTQHFIDSKWCQWELEMAQHKLFSEDREFLVLLELEPLERRRLPRLLRFLLDTRPVVRWPRPETAPAVLAAAAELRGVLGPSLRQRLLRDPPPAPSTLADDDRAGLIDSEAQPRPEGATASTCALWC